MARQDFSDETLMAYADGELDPETARTVVAAAEADEGIARRIALFTGTRDALGQAARTRPLEPLPEALATRVDETLAAARGAQVIPFHRRAPLPRFAALATAAGVALVLGLTGGYLLAPQAPRGDAFAALGEPVLAGVLSSVPSGERRALAAGDFAAIASFTAADGAFCREFELTAGTAGATTVAVACTTGEGWQPRFAVLTQAGGEGYAPASGLDTLETWLDATAAGPAMTAEEEAAALAGLARR